MCPLYGLNEINILESEALVFMGLPVCFLSSAIAVVACRLRPSSSYSLFLSHHKATDFRGLFVGFLTSGSLFGESLRQGLQIGS